MRIPPRSRRITLPERLGQLLDENRELSGVVTATLARFETWLEKNGVVFFREYTDHGPDHVNQVLATASSIIADDAWDILTPADAAVLALATLLHDAAMHIREDGFAALVTDGQAPAPAFARHDAPWPQLWHQYLGEASRFDSRRLTELFGDDAPIRVPPLERLKMNDRDRLLIGDFLRRHHARLAHEIALHGVPGPGALRLMLSDIDPVVADISGLVARSHNLPIRSATDVLGRHERRVKRSVHVPFMMAVLRIADYIQVQSERAPGELLMVEALRSPISRAEWQTHAAVETIHTEDDDPEAIVIVARPPSIRDFAKLDSLLKGIQRELDETWALLGEVYGARKLGLNVRRIKSNLDDRAAFAETVGYFPTPAAFSTAGADLLALLVGPLYDYNPAIAVRELLQNALDAVRERTDLQPGFNGKVEISIDTDAQKQSWLTLKDNGVGMTVDTVIHYFLCAGASFRRSDYWRSHHTTADGKSRVLRSGRFGIGALAAFLAGNKIFVITRHLDQSAGIEFNATLDDQYVEMRRIECEIGTTIRVPLTAYAAEMLFGHTDSWDWYCLASPQVVRRIERGILKQKIMLPDAGSVLISPYRRITAKGFTDVQWAYLSDTIFRAPDIICNGILVKSTRLWGQPSADLDPLIWRPDLSIFDTDGLLPLDLKRTGVHAWAFEDELIADIVGNIIAFVAVTGSDQSPLNTLLAEHPAMNTSYPYKSWLCCTPGGWTIAHPAMIPPHLDRVVIVATDEFSDWRPVEGPISRSVDLRKSVVIHVRLRRSDKTLVDGFLDMVHSDNGPHSIWTARGLVGMKFSIVGSVPRAYVHAEYDICDKSENDVRSFGQSFRAITRFDRFQAEVDRERFAAIAEAKLRTSRPSEKVVASKVVKAWLKHLPSGVIPYSVKDRKKILARKGLAGHAAMYEKK